MPARQYAASSILCAAGHESRVRASNRADGMFLQDPFDEINFARRRRAVTASLVSDREAATSLGLAIRIRSQPEARAGSMGRITSRSSRLARLRDMAVPTVFPAVTPTL